jgi:hypothetical protein
MSSTDAIMRCTKPIAATRADDVSIYPSVAKAGGVQSQGANGEAVVIYCDPLATQDLGASGFPGRVKNEKIIVAPLDCPFGQIQSFRKKHGF